jgi:hypothetical protein
MGGGVSVAQHRIFVSAGLAASASLRSGFVFAFGLPKPVKL